MGHPLLRKKAKPVSLNEFTEINKLVSDMKETFPHSIKRDGLVDIVSGDSLAAIVFGLCRENYNNLNRIESDLHSLKADVYDHNKHKVK